MVAEDTNLKISTVPSEKPGSSSERASGVLLVDKPVGITSHDVVDIARRVYRVRRIGHTGTLDPAASGLMLLLIGTATKVAPYLTAMDKTYRASIRFGATSDTGDAEGTLTPKGNPDTITESALRNALGQVTGTITQNVPAYAAVRSGGRRRYEIARSGETVPPMERETEIFESELLSLDLPVAVARFRCASGTYIRALAECIGETLACGAYLDGLRRESVGAWHVDDALSVERLRELKRGDAALTLSPIEQFLDYPRIEVTPECASTIAQGREITNERIVTTHGEIRSGKTTLLTDAEGHALAIGTALFDADDTPGGFPDGTLFQYRRVLVS